MDGLALLWCRLPVVVRAVATGMAIQLAGVFSFGILAQLNLGLAPTIPWSVPVELAILWLIYRYLRGDGWPSSTQRSRRRRLRARAVPRSMLPATIATGLALGCAILLNIVVAYRVVAMPAAAGGALLTFLSAPPLTAAAILATGVIMTGFIEEAAFRGYMQQPIEERHGAAVAILLVAVLFAAVHSPPLLVLPLFALGAVGWGVYVRLARSTVPAMVVHAAVDAVAFTWVIVDPEALPSLLAASMLDHGIDAFSRVAIVGAVITSAATCVGFLWMARVRRGLVSAEG
jgi:membrane protease YdiL (CAAX protease family)